MHLGRRLSARPSDVPPNSALRPTLTGTAWQAEGGLGVLDRPGDWGPGSETAPRLIMITGVTLAVRRHGDRARGGQVAG
jgi:hypothetical protein